MGCCSRTSVHVFGLYAWLRINKINKRHATSIFHHHVRVPPLVRFQPLGRVGEPWDLIKFFQLVRPRLPANTSRQPALYFCLRIRSTDARCQGWSADAVISLADRRLFRTHWLSYSWKVNCAASSLALIRLWRVCCQPAEMWSDLQSADRRDRVIRLLWCNTHPFARQTCTTAKCKSQGTTCRSVVRPGMLRRLGQNPKTRESLSA